MSPAPYAATIERIKPTITIEFGENLDAATINGSNVVVKGSISGIVTSQLLTGDNMLTIVPERFMAGEDFSVILSNRITSSTGNELIEGAQYQFSVKNTGSPTTPPAFVKMHHSEQRNSFEFVTTDFEKDGYPDLAIGEWYRNDIYKLTNTGKQDFNIEQNYLSRISRLRNIDLDNDNIAEIAFLSDGNLYWLDPNDFSSMQLLFDDPVRNFFVADLNSDGSDDLLLVLERALYWAENTGSGSFSKAVPIYESASGHLSLCVFDSDNDSDLDIMAFTVDKKMVFLENQGYQNFSSKILPIEAYYHNNTLIAKDLNNDGLADLVLESKSRDNFGWIKNMGNNEFGFQLITGSQANLRISAVDFDNDGWQDLVYRRSKSVLWRRQSAPEVFDTEEVLFVSETFIHNLEILDLDSDGDLDLLTTAEENLFTYLNTNNVKSFVSADDERLLPKDTLDLGIVSAADELNISLLIDNAGNEQLDISDVILSNGLSMAEQIPSSISATQSFETQLQVSFDELGPFSGDLTFITNDPEMLEFSLHVKAQFVGMQIVSIYPERKTLLSDRESIDITFDEILDSNTISNSSIYVNSHKQGKLNGALTLDNSDSTLVFTPAAAYMAGDKIEIVITKDLLSSAGLPHSVDYQIQYSVGYEEYTLDSLFFMKSKILDVTETSELIAGKFDGENLSLLQSSSHPYDTAKLINLPEYSYELFPGDHNDVHASYVYDIDQDRDLDILLYKFGGTLQLITNNSGTYEESVFFELSGADMIIPEDIDNDQDIDLVTLHYVDSETKIWENDGSNQFEERITLPGSKYYIADFDKNGLKDIAICSFFSSEIYSQSSKWQFERSTLLDEMGIYNVHFDYLNDDEHLDLIYSEGTSNSTKMRFGNESGFESEVTLLSHDGPIHTTDFDGDGNIDILVYEYSSDVLDVLLNEGNGSFDHRMISTEMEIRAVEYADMNEDGLADLVISMAPDPNLVFEELWIYELAYPIRFTVIDDSKVYSSGDTVSFGSVPTRSDVNQEISIANTGRATLEISNWQSTSNITLQEISFVVPDDTVEFSFSINTDVAMDAKESFSFETNANIIEPEFAMNVVGEIYQITGIEDELAGYVIYPNPASDLLNINLSGNPEIDAYEIVDVSGKMILSKYDNSADTQIDVSKLKTGIYLLKIVSGEKVYKSRFAVK